MFASISFDEIVRLWSAPTAHLQNTITSHAWGVESVCFSPDGHQLVSGSQDETVRLWSTNTGHLQRTFVGHTYMYPVFTDFPASSVYFSPDGRMLASASSFKGVRLWDVATGQPVKYSTRFLIGGKTYSVCFSPDSTILAIGYTGGVQLQSIASWSERQILKTKDRVSFSYSVCFSPDGRMIAASSGSEVVLLWDAATGHLQKTFTGHKLHVMSVCFSPDGRMIASGGLDGTVRLWDTATGQHLKTLIEHGDFNYVYSVCFSPDGKTIASGGADKNVRLWDTTTGKHLKALIGHTGRVKSVCFSPDGITLASGSTDGTVLLWDVSKDPVQSLPEPSPSEENKLPTLYTPQQIAKKALAATIVIVVEDKNGLPLGSGSGFFISRDMIATNLHVVKTGHRATFKRVGKDKWYNVKEVIEKNTQQDLVILKVPDVGATVLSLGNSDAIEVGEPVYAIGNPKGLEGTFSPGFISSIRAKDSNRRIQITAPISPGSSGGPVLNNEGEVIGIVVGAITEGQNLNFAIPSNYLQKLLDKAKKQNGTLR